MGQLTIEQRVCIVDQNHSNKSPTKLKTAFANEYSLKTNIKTVSKVVSKWRESGTIHNLNKGHLKRLKHVRSEENIVISNERLQENPSLSVRKTAAEVGISHESASRILKADLDLKYCEMQISQQLSITDNKRRLQFCQQINGSSEEGQLDVNTIIFSDESHIYINGIFRSFHFGWRLTWVAGLLFNNEHVAH